MSISHLVRQLCLSISIGTILFAGTAWANDDEPDIETYGYKHIDPRGAGIFSVQFPGENYDALSGKIGHRYTDMASSGNGNLPIRIQRDFKEVPKAYPYAFGNMDLVVPHLTIETAWSGGHVGNGDSTALGDLDFKCDVTGPITTTNTNFEDTWRRIAFDYEGGRVNFVARAHIKATTLAHFPTEAKFISPNNWFVSCAADNPAIFEVRSPDGTVYRLVQRERFESRRRYEFDETGNGNLSLNTTFMIFANQVKRDGTTLTYEYERPSGWTTTDFHVYPPLIQGSLDGHRNVLRNKYRVKRLFVSNTMNNDPREITINYRPNSGECPNLIESIQSNYAKGGIVNYSYTRNQNDSAEIYVDQCLLERVTYKDGSFFHFRYGEPGKSYQVIEGSEISSGPQASLDDPSTAYFSLMEVTAPTGASVQYEYAHLGTCEYQDSDKSQNDIDYHVVGECGGREVVRPAVTDRTVSELTTPIQGSSSTALRNEVANPSFLKSEQQFHYEKVNQNNASPPDFSQNRVERKIVSDARSHRLEFGRIDRYGEPNEVLVTPPGGASKMVEFGDPSENNFDSGRLLHSGKLLEHEVIDNPSQGVLSRTEYIYQQSTNFLDFSSITYPRIDYFSDPLLNYETSKHHPYKVLKWNWVFDALRMSTYSSTVHYNDTEFVTRYRSRNIYDMPAYTDHWQLQGSNQERRTTHTTYDNALNSVSLWRIGLPATTHTARTGGNDLPVETEKATSTRVYTSTGLLASKHENGSTTTYTYHPNGDLKTVTNGNGHTTTYLSYKMGAAQTVNQPNGGTVATSVFNDGNIKQIDDASGIRKNYRYDSSGRLSQTWEGVTSTGQVFTTHASWTGGTFYRKRRDYQSGLIQKDSTFDALGRVTRTEVTSLKPDGEKIFRDYHYDQLGRVHRVSDPMANATSGWPGIKYEYDAFDRVKELYHTATPTEKLTYCYGPPCNANALFNKAGTVKNGYVVRDQEGFQTHYDFRALGHPANEELMNVYQHLMVDDGGAVSSNIIRTAMDRNLHGFIRSVKQGHSDAWASAPTRIYDPHVDTTGSMTSWVKKETHPEFANAREVLSFDGIGNPVSVKQHDNSQLQYVYDNLGNLDTVSVTGHSVQNGLLADYTYRTNGDVTELDAGDTNWLYTYEPNKSLLGSETLTIGSSQYPIDYTYDNNNQLTEIDYPGSLSLTYTRDGFGRPTKLTGQLGSRTLTFADSVTYHPSGQIEQLVHGNGHTFTTTQDNRLRPDSWQVSHSGFSIDSLNLDYQFDSRGNVQRINGYFGPNGGDLHGLTYDGLNRLTNATGSWGEATFAYDDRGNIKSAVRPGMTQIYSYDGSERLTAVSTTDAGQIPAYTVAHDDNGNVISTGFMDMSYDVLNRMVTSVRDTGINQKTHGNTYDGNNHRSVATKSINTASGLHVTTTHQVYTASGDLLYEQDIEAGETRSHIKLGGKTIASLGEHQAHDSDGDQIPDYYERLHGLNPLSALDAAEDDDNDNLSNAHEYLVGGFPTNEDSDHDGLPDAWEVNWAFDPTDFSDAAADADNDGVSNLAEYGAGTNPVDDQMTPSERMYLVPILYQHAM